MSLPIIVVGAGGHAAVVVDALLEAGAKVLGFTDPDLHLHGTQRIGLPVLGSDDEVLGQFAPDRVSLANGLGFVNGSGQRSLRAVVQLRLEARGWQFVSVIHPLAHVSSRAKLGASCQILAGAHVQAGASVGTGTIVNTGAIVEHDSIVGHWCHLATRSTLCGHCRVGDGSLVGAGAVLRQGVAIGKNTVVGAGAVLVRDSAGEETLCGVPARPLGTK
ncbi:MAG: acetyltransferase [Paludibacterium sp.]|uniref:acetyltransferase n=1 Tax=Paludibacterium sp. TaxID=1917523 RepID=UPI0025D11540|nr:acetyltransferase [Paludibacterium sp.]MBV8047221.1 acetyltransferase [Paludibacterium sp.]MBV8467931.1 acetyltransferase [Burkholderiales bacterium]